MLPTEIFAEAIAFLRLADLGALAFTNALCSALAAKAFAVVRWEEFSDLHFDMTTRGILIYRLAEDEDGYIKQQRVVDLGFSDATAMAEFIDAAFPNCIFENVEISWCYEKSVLDAIAHVADSVIVNGALCLPRDMSHRVSLNLVRKFRKAKALELRRPIGDEEVGTLADFFSERGIDVLWYNRRYGSRARYFPVKKC